MENKYRIFTQNLNSDNGTEPWQKISERSKDVLKLVASYKPDIFCIQEGTPEWMSALTQNLPDFAVEFVNRDTRDKTECTAIFYKSDRFDLMETKTFWLSETPDTMSSSWLSNCLRICTYALLKDKTTQTELAVFNTHLDHRSHLARINGAKLILNKIHELAYGKNVILTGDMNAREKISVVYKLLSTAMLDAKYNARYSMVGKTYNDYGNPLHKFNILPIDYVFLGRYTPVTINNYKIIKDMGAGGHYISDHFGLLVDVEY